MRTEKLLYGLLAGGVLWVGCGSNDEPVSYSEAIGINLKAKSGDAKEGVIRDEKGITTETGNPFGSFIKEAKIKLGHEPSRVDLSALTLTLGAKSVGTTLLEEVFLGEVEILFLFDDSKNTLNVGRVTNPTGSGPVAFKREFDSGGMSEADRNAFFNGSFKIVIRGPASAGFATKKIEAELLITLNFEAFE